MSATKIRRIEDSTPRPARGRWQGAIACLAAAALSAWWIEPRGFETWMLVPVALAVAGVVQAVRAVLASARARRFGVTVLDVEGGHVDQGGELRGRVLTSRELAPAAGFRLRLRCTESVRVLASDGSSQSRTVDRVTFEAESVVAGSGSSARDGIPVRFQIPEQAIRTSTSSRGARWTLVVDADVDGEVYEALFDVPVASRGAGA